MLTFRKLRFYRRLVTVSSCAAPLRHCLIVILANIAHNLLRDIPKFSPSITKLCPDHSLPPLSAAHLHPEIFECSTAAFVAARFSCTAAQRTALRKLLCKSWRGVAARAHNGSNLSAREKDRRLHTAVI